MLQRYWLTNLFCDAATAVDAAGAGNGGPAAKETQTISPAAKPGSPNAPPNAQSFASEIMQHIGPQLQGIVADQIKPIQDQATQLAKDLEEAKKPQRQAATLFGGGPGHGGVIVGE